MRILHLYADNKGEWNSSEWRCIIPAEAIKRAGEHQVRYLWIWEALKPSANAHFEWAQLIIVERMGWNVDDILHVADFIRRLKSIGKKVMLDFDDAYHLMPPSVSTSVLWRQNLVQIPDGVEAPRVDATVHWESGKKVRAFRVKEPILTQFRKTLRAVDGFSTPSEVLTGDFAHLNPRHYVIRNYPDLSRPEWHTKKRGHGDQIIIGWGGGSTHYESFRNSGVIPALRQIIRQYPSVRFLICTSDQSVVKALGLPPEKLVLEKFRPFREWPPILDNFDIGIAPLAGKYDDRRSWIKALEYGVKGIPWVASDAPPYQQCTGGIRVKNKPKHWYKWLAKLVEGTNLRSILAKEGQDWARDQGIDDHIEERLAVYEEILA